MRNLILLIFIMKTVVFYTQENSIENKEIRVQGYLFTITTLDEPRDVNADTIIISIDKPKRHFFISLNDMLPTFKETLNKVNDFKSNYLYLPLTLTESERRIQSTCSDLKFYLKNNTIQLSQVEEYSSFLTYYKETTIQLIEDKGTKWVYNVVYIDGIWERYRVPFKWTEALSIGSYRSNNLDKNHKEGYDYYFLKDINVISYKLDIKEKGIVVLNSNDKGSSRFP